MSKEADIVREIKSLYREVTILRDKVKTYKAEIELQKFCFTKNFTLEKKLRDLEKVAVEAINYFIEGGSPRNSGFLSKIEEITGNKE